MHALSLEPKKKGAAATAVEAASHSNVPVRSLQGRLSADKGCGVGGVRGV